MTDEELEASKYPDEPEIASLVPPEEQARAVDLGPSVMGDELHERIRVANAKVAALHGHVTGPRNVDAFRRVISFDKNPGRECALKNHFVGCARELIGYLENLLEQFPNDQRFLFVKIANIAEHAFKYPRLADRNYGQRQLEYSLTLARNVGALSPLLRGSRGKQGFVLASHASLCERVGNECRWVGPFGVSGSFTITVAGVVWRSDEGDRVSFSHVTKRGPKGR